MITMGKEYACLLPSGTLKVGIFSINKLYFDHIKLYIKFHQHLFINKLIKEFAYFPYDKYGNGYAGLLPMINISTKIFKYKWMNFNHMKLNTKFHKKY
jgi:hypothetical protein